jgi:dihydroflavonol-4-reductase
MVHALVTGGTGFLGSHVARALIAAGHTARILRRQRSPLDLVSDLPAEHAIGDILDRDSLRQAMQGCAWVFHVAATSDYWRSNKTRLYLVNVEGTRTVLEVAREVGVQRVIFTSSGAAVGFREDGTPADESVAFNVPPQHFPYGHSKWLAEQEAWRAVQGGQDVLAVNPAAVFGPGDLNLISGSAVVEIARGSVVIYPAGGMTTIDVRDVARAHVVAATHGKTGERYLLGNENLSHQALQAMIARIVGKREPFIPVPPSVTPALAAIVGALRTLGLRLPIDANQIRLSSRHVYFDCGKAWAAFGKPEISIQHSLQATYDWYVAHGVIAPRNL